MTKLTVNDRPVQYRMDPDTPLLWALRDASNLTGTKYGCGNGDCGACIVDVDGEAIRSCLVLLSEVEGRFVTTIEALVARPRSSGAAGVRRRTGGAVRLLHLGPHHGERGAAAQEQRSQR